VRLIVTVVAALAALCAAQPDPKALEDVTTGGELVDVVRQWMDGPDVMTTWYIKSGESGGGTSTSDYAGTWAAIASSVGSSDTVYVHGDSILRETIDIDDAGVTFTAETGTGRWTQTGRQLIDAADWAVHTTVGGRTIYKEPVASAPVGFVYGYGFNDVTDANGTTQSIPTGHLIESAETTLANFITDITNNDRPSWYFNSGNSTLYVYFPDNDDPRSSGTATEWLLNPGGTGFRVSADNVTISGGRVDCWLAPTSGDTYWGFQLNGVEGCDVSDMVTSDVFYHSLGATGGKCVSNTFSNFTCYTVARGTDSHLVQYSNSGALTGGSFTNGTLHMSDLRQHDGTVLNRFASSNPVKALAGHAGASGSIAAGGLVYDSITIIDYSDCHGSGGTQAVVASGGNGSGPTDRDTVTDYQWIVRDCTIQAAILGQTQSDGYVAFQRCYLTIDGTTSGGISQANYVNASGGEVLFESCVMPMEMATGTNNVSLRGADKVTLSNCTVYCKGDSDGFYFGAATGDLKATHCLFVRENAGYFAKGGSMASPTMSKNWYDVNITDTQFAVPTAFNDQSEWVSTIDTAGTYDVDFSAQFSSLTTLQPTTTSDVWTTLDATANPETPTGINGNAYNGNAGAWQAGSSGGGRSRSRMRRRSRSAF